jgi:hypothetical protein
MNYAQLFNYIVEDEKVIIESAAAKNITDLVIPGDISGIPVLEISNDAFSRCKLLKRAIIPDTVKLIGDGAFNECTDLAYVKLPCDLERIGDNVFSNCRNLDEIIIPESVKEIGYEAFYGCNVLRELIIPGKVERIKERAFADCIRLSNIVFLFGDCDLGFRAFYRCRSLKSVTMRYENTKLDFYSHAELAGVREIKVRIYENDDKYIEHKVFVPTDELKTEGYNAIHREYCKLFKDGFTWEGYDKAYSTLNDIEKKIDVSAYRMICRDGLTEEMEKDYFTFLKKHSKVAITQFLDYNDIAGLEVLADTGIITRFNIRKIIKLAEKMKRDKCKEFLVEYKNKRL